MQTTPVRTAFDWVLSIRSEPTETELRARFSESFLAAVPIEQLGVMLPDLVAKLSDDIAEMQVVEHDGQRLTATVGQTQIVLQVTAAVEAQIAGLQFKPVAATVSDPRLTDPPTTSSGVLPMADLAARIWRDDGLVGLTMHVQNGEQSSTATIGWADLDAGRGLLATDVFPAYSITKLLTTVAVLQLVDAGEIDLEASVASLVTSLVVPADITVRHLLTHHGAVKSGLTLWADEVPDLVDVLGSEVAVDGPPGEQFAYSNGGFGVLGQLVADVVGSGYAEVVERRILRPLGMTSSSFPLRVPGDGVVLHEVADDGAIVAGTPKICTVPPAGGLWSTAADLAIFGRDWATLLTPETARAAISPQAMRSPGSWIGFGFLLASSNGRKVVGHAGGGVGAKSSLLAMPDDDLVAIALVNRAVAVEAGTFALLRLALDR